MRFDSGTNVKPGWPIEGGRDFVDAIFAFSSPLGNDYSGAWRDESIFAVTVLQPASTPPRFNRSIANSVPPELPTSTASSPASTASPTTVRVLGNVRGAAGARPSAASGQLHAMHLTGDYGSFQAPLPTSVIVGDPDNSELGFGPGDTLTLGFSIATPR